MKLAALLTCLFLAWPSSVRAGILYTSQSRGVSANAKAAADPPITDSETVTATDFGPFKASATALADYRSPPPFNDFAYASGLAQIDSALGTRSILAIGNAFADGDRNQGNSANAGASSWMTVHFSLNLVAPRLAELSGFVQGLDEVGEVRLTGPKFGSYDVNYYFGEYQTLSNFLESFLLPPGQHDYVLSVGAGGSAVAGQYISGSLYSVSFSYVPEPSSLALLAAGSLCLAVAARKRVACPRP